MAEPRCATTGMVARRVNRFHWSAIPWLHAMDVLVSVVPYSPEAMVMPVS